MDHFVKCSRKFIKPILFATNRAYISSVTKTASHVPIASQITIFKEMYDNNINGFKKENETLILGSYLSANIIHEPITIPKLYKFPIRSNIFEINDIHNGNVIQESPQTHKNPPIQAGKSDLPWRRRRMRRHRLLKWRKKYRSIFDERVRKRMEKRAVMKNDDLQKSWEKFGLKKEPPKLSETEKNRLVNEWRKDGIWTDGLTDEEKFVFHRAATIMKHTDKKN